MTSPTHTTDVAIIGAGPIGLFAVFQCGMLGMKCHVADALEVVGGQCRALYPEKPIYDIPAHSEVTGNELIDHLEAQIAPFGAVFHVGQQVVTLDQTENERWIVKTSNGTTIEAAAVIIAAGVGAFGPNRPPLEGLKRYESLGEGCGVNYLVKSREAFRGKKVVVAGGGDSAVDWAISLSGLAESLAIVHRRPKFRATPGSTEKLKELAEAGQIELVTPFQLSGLEGDKNLEAVLVRDLDGNSRRLEADVLLPFYGLSQDLGPIAEWGLDLDMNRITVDPATCSSGKPGLFAIGDISVYPGKLKLILTGFSEAAMAAYAAFAKVYPGKALHFEYSTSQGAPGAES